MAKKSTGFLEAVPKPKELSVVHCRGHQKGHSEGIQENNMADVASGRPTNSG